MFAFLSLIFQLNAVSIKTFSKFCRRNFVVCFFGALRLKYQKRATVEKKINTCSVVKQVSCFQNQILIVAVAFWGLGLHFCFVYYKMLLLSTLNTDLNKFYEND